MPNITAPPFAFPAKSFPGNSAGVQSGIAGEFLSSVLMGPYATLAKLGKVYSAYATVTAPVIFSTAAGSGGPLIWNKPNSGVDAHILGVGVSVSVASAVAGAVGLSCSTGQTAAPTSTTAIDGSGNCLVGGAASACNAYRVGTVANAGGFIMPVFNVGTTATSAQFVSTWVDIGGSLVIPPGNCGFVCGTATLTTLAAGITLIWAELPT